MGDDENLPENLMELIRIGLKQDAYIKHKAIEIAKNEGLDKDESVILESSEFYGKLQDYAMHKLAFYECSGCLIPFFGGLKSCHDLDEESKNPEYTLKCPDCLSREKIGS